MFSLPPISKSRKIWLWIIFLTAGDLLSKRLFFDLHRGSQLPFLHPLFNNGISRGIMLWLPLVMGVSLIGLGIFTRLRTKKELNNLIFILLFAGTLGNLLDRVFLGGVRDFIAIGTFPVFNIADVLLTLAVFFFLRYEIFPCNWHQKPYPRSE